MQRFNTALLKTAMAAIAETERMEKKGFVPMPGGGTEPVAGASAATAALAGGGMGGDPSQQPVDPATGAPIDPNTGLPLDPAMAGGAPVDPAMAGGAPVDPAAAGAAPAPEGAAMDPSVAGMPSPTPDGMIQMPVSQFITLLETLGAAGKKGTAKPSGAGAAPAGGGMESMVMEMHKAMQNAGMLQPSQPQA
jgi:hypothetical protein